MFHMMFNIVFLQIKRVNIGNNIFQNAFQYELDVLDRQIISTTEQGQVGDKLVICLFVCLHLFVCVCHMLVTMMTSLVTKQISRNSKQSICHLVPKCPSHLQHSHDNIHPPPHLWPNRWGGWGFWSISFTFVILFVLYIVYVITQDLTDKQPCWICYPV